MTRPPASTRSSAFARGLRSLGLGPPAAAVIAAVLTLALLQWVVASGAVMRLPERYFLLWEHDNTTHVVWRVRELQRHLPRGTPVYLLGGSALRESIASEASLSALVRAAGGKAGDAQVIQLTGFNRSFAEDLAILDNLPGRAGSRSGLAGLLVLGVNVKSFLDAPELAARQAAGSQVLLPSPSLRRYLASDPRLPPRAYGLLPGTLRYLLRYPAWKSRDLLSLRAPTVEYVQHVYGVDDRRGLAVNTRTAALRAAELGPVFDRNLSSNARMLDYLVHQSQEHGYAVLVLDLPRNKEAVGHLWDARVARYQAACRAIAARRGIRFVDLNGNVDLHDSDFYDLVHLVEPGRKIWQPPLAREIARTLRDGR